MTTYADRPWIHQYDKGIPPTLEPYPTTPLHELLQASAVKLGACPALITSAKLPVLGRQKASLSYTELDHLSDALAAALVDLGLKKGDRVAVILPNVAQFPIAFYAILKAGGVVAGTNPTYPAARMQHQINDCGAEIVITLSLFYPLVKEVQHQTKVKYVITTNVKEYLPPLARMLFTVAKEKKDGHAVRNLGARDFFLPDLLQNYAGQKPPKIETHAEDVALFQYTGGTTGVSKGAMLTHANLVANTVQIQTAWQKIQAPRFQEVDPTQILFFGVLPMFHAAGLVVVLAQAIASGSPILLVPNPRDIHELVDLIHVFQPNIFVGVPALYNAINNHPRVKSGEVSLKSLLVSSCGTAPLSPATKRTYEEISGNVITEGYGMSECIVTHANPLVKPTKIGSVGLPYPDNDVKVISLDDGLTEMPVGEIGEIVMCGPTVMKGYHNMPTETANTLRQHPDGRTWLHSGDIGYMDEDGYFYLVDRKKDMVIIGGYNVYPTNVEKALMEHPAILEAGVAGIEHPDKVGQEAVKAWVVLKPNHTATQADLIAHCEKLLAPYEVPRRFSFVQEIPKSAVGKVLRRELILLEQVEREKRA